MPRLTLYLLGPPKIECDGLPVKMNRRKAVALLAYLAVTGESHPRDNLVNLLWPELDSTRGRAALRRTLYALNQALEGLWLEVDREEIGLAPCTDPPSDPERELRVDVVHFRHLLAQCESHGHSTAQVCPACVPFLTEAVDLVGGEFLSGFSLKDSINFDDWQLFQAERVRRELAGALERLVDWHSRQREFESAATYARRRLALDPLDEETHRQLMRLYTWSGRRSAALRQYEECASTLAEHLGLSPQEATTTLYRAVQSGHVPPPPEEEAKPKSPELPAKPPPFLAAELVVEQPACLARERELARLHRFLDLALAGQGRVAFVIGEAGSGKTTLLHEFARRAQEAHADVIVASGNCNAYTGIGDPYLPFREILELLTGDVEARWAAGALTSGHARRLWNTLPLAAQALTETGPDLVGTFVPCEALQERITACLPGPAEWLVRLDELVERKQATPGMRSPQQNDLFEQFTKVLQVLTRKAPLILVVDDLQWADLGSISLLFHLGRQLAGSRLLILGAYRPEEVAIGRDGKRHPLVPVTNEFQRDFGNITMNLSQVEGRDFVEALLNSEPNKLTNTFREMLYRKTRGHPLFTIELLRGLQERGDLVQDLEGHWIEGPTLDWGRLPARVEAVIAERIGRLSRPLRAALRVASVEGEVFTAEVVARLLAVDERNLVQDLSRELDRRHRLVGAQAIVRMGMQRLSRYRFRNYLFQKYLYDNLDQVERVYLHEDVGRVLEELHGDQAGEISVQLAWHFREAGIAEKAIHYLHQAGDRAVRLSAYQEGVAHLSQALALLTALPESPHRAEQELALQLSMGMAWLPQNPRPELRDAFVRARELCRLTGKTSPLWLILSALSTYHYVRADHQTARDLAEEALSLAQQAGDPLVVALGRWHLGFVLFSLGDYTTAHTHFERVISSYDPQQHHQPLLLLRGSDAGLSALAYDACCLWCLGYPDQALRRGQESLALAQEFNHAFTLADVLWCSGCMLHAMCQNPLAYRQYAQQLVQVSEEMRFPSWLGTGTCHLGEALAKLGHVQEGIAQIRDGIDARRSMGVRLDLARAYCTLAEAQAQAGEPRKGLVTLAEARALVEETNERHWEAEIYRLQGELLLAQAAESGTEAGQHQAERSFRHAESSFRRSIEVARRQKAKSWELRATTSLARLRQKQGRVDEARKVLAEIYGWFTEGFDTSDLQQAQTLLNELT